MTVAAFNDDRALRVPGTTARHEPTDEDWRRLSALLAPHYEGGLFTILQVDRARGLVRRAYTSNACDYPTGGTKQLMGTPWAQHVIHDARRFIATTNEEMRGAFADYETLFALGCTTAMNVPLRQGMGVAWTVNLLRGGNVYTVTEGAEVNARIEEWVEELYPNSKMPRTA